MVAFPPLLRGLRGGAGLAWLGSVAGSDGSHAVVGASGAISGLAGFLVAVAPRLGFRVYTVWRRPDRDAPMPVVVWIGLWLLFEIPLLFAGQPFAATAALHLGGFALGFALARLLRAPFLRGTVWYLPPIPGGGGEEEARLERTAMTWRARAEASRARRAAERSHEPHPPVEHLPPLDLPPRSS
jgi:hypothetical protein